MTDEDYMAIALRLADDACQAGEVPVGALVVLDGEIIGRGWNRPIGNHDPSAHAELLAIRAAARNRQNYRLPGAILYVTIEPCVMCVGAMIHARIARLVYGAPEPKTGAVESVFTLLDDGVHNHNIAVSGEVLAQQCAAKMRAFFATRR